MEHFRIGDHVQEPRLQNKDEDAETPIDVARRFVRVTRRNQAGFIEFQFSIHHKELFVELVLPDQAFEEFCMRNRVTFLEPLREGVRS